MISEPFYFGQNNTCFGHFMPLQDMSQGKAVLIVPSIFGEAIRSHFVAREVAKSLVKQGYDVLRFDFDGDGNSCSKTRNTSVRDWIRNIQDGYDELVNRLNNASVSVFSIRFGAGLSLVALEERPVESFVLWDPIFSTRKMYDIFVGQDSVTNSWDVQGSDNPFEHNQKHSGFFEVGVGKEFADEFLLIEDAGVPNCDVQIINTGPKFDEERRASVSGSVVLDVSHQCNWQMKDLPVIFAPKIVSTVCACF